MAQLTKRQRIGNQIDAAFIFALADFVNVHEMPQIYTIIGAA